jgi:hypothetical protein
LPIVEQVMFDARRRSDVRKGRRPLSKGPLPRAGRPCSFVGWAPCKRRPSWVTGSDDVRTLASGRGTPLDRHDYEADTHTRDVVEHLSQEIAALRAEQSQLLALVDHREDGEIRSRRFARTATDR